MFLSLQSTDLYKTHYYPLRLCLLSVRDHRPVQYRDYVPTYQLFTVQACNSTTCNTAVSVPPRAVNSLIVDAGLLAGRRGAELRFADAVARCVRLARLQWNCIVRWVLSILALVMGAENGRPMWMCGRARDTGNISYVDVLYSLCLLSLWSGFMPHSFLQTSAIKPVAYFINPADWS